MTTMTYENALQLANTILAVVSDGYDNKEDAILQADRKGRLKK